MFLSDEGIDSELVTNNIEIDPYDRSQLQPASYDLLLGNQFKRMRSGYQIIDPFNLPDGLYEDVVVPEGSSLILRPGNLVLGTTVERIYVGEWYSANVEGKSSLARLGLVIHHTGGFIDPGFNGQITLEFSCQTTAPIKLWPGMKIAQIRFSQLSSRCKKPYGHPDLCSKYQDQQGVTESRYHLNRI